MEDFKKTPKLVSLRKIEKPILKHISLRDLFKSKNYLIYLEKDKYVIRHKDSDKSEELGYVVYRNFALSSLVLKTKELLDSLDDLDNFKGSRKHPKFEEITLYSIQSRKELNLMLSQLNKIVQDKIFTDGK